MATELLRAYPNVRPIYEVDDALCDAAGSLTEQALKGGIADKVKCRNDFWRFFRDVLRQWIRDEHRRQSAEKRGGGGSTRTTLEGDTHSVLGSRSAGKEVRDDLDFIASKDLGPDVIVLTEEIIQRLFGLLDEDQSMIASLRLSDLAAAKIAKKLGLSERTISRRLKEIQEIWTESGLLD